MVFADAGTRIMLIVINQVVTWYVVGASYAKMMVSLKEPILASGIMGIFCMLSYGVAQRLGGLGFAIDIVLCIVVYFAACMIMPKSRDFLLGAVHNGLKKRIG